MTAPEQGGEIARHDPTYLTSNRSHWATCSCGWRSLTYSTSTGVQLAFGRHLVQEADRG